MRAEAKSLYEQLKGKADAAEDEWHPDPNVVGGDRYGLATMTDQEREWISESERSKQRQERLQREADERALEQFREEAAAARMAADAAPAGALSSTKNDDASAKRPSTAVRVQVARRPAKRPHVDEDPPVVKDERATKKTKRETLVGAKANPLVGLLAAYGPAKGTGASGDGNDNDDNETSSSSLSSSTQ